VPNWVTRWTTCGRRPESEIEEVTRVDERKLEELFRSAVRDAPPASFDHTDVTAAAERISRRRRSMLASGGGLAVVVLAVGLFLGLGGLRQTQGGTSSTAGYAAAPRSDSAGTKFVPQPFADQRGGAAGGTSGFPSGPPMQGGGSSGKVGPGADSTRSGCGPTDEQLAVALANELSSVGAPAAIPATLTCPSGTRSASFYVGADRVTALLVPAAAAGRVSTQGAASSDGRSASGAWQVYVLGTPAVPSGVDLAAVQHAIGTHF
jgi:hypothetical protein